MDDKHHMPCPKCGSSDARSYYGDGHEHCYSCGDHTGTNNEEEVVTRTEIKELKFSEYRGLTQATCSKFGIVSAYDNSGQRHHVRLPYTSDGTVYKLRPMDRKTFPLIGDKHKRLALFGMDKFPAGSAKTITITEGEVDAASVYQMMGDFPVVSIKGASSAKTDCQEAYDYLNSFETIVLALDADEHGEKASRDIAGIFNPNKIKFAKLDPQYKDANAYLQAGKQAEFKKVWWAAEKYKPKGIIESFNEVEGALRSSDAEPIAEYPYPTLQEMTLGIRPGEIVLWKALEKVGKTEILRGIEYHLIKNTDINIGIIHLEEPEKRSIQGLLSYEFDTPLHLPHHTVSVDDQVARYRDMVGREGRVYYYTHFGSDDPDVILDMVRYLVTVCECKVIFLDHITMIVTGHETDDERRKLDYISTRLATMCVDLKFNLQLVSHVNDQGQTRGSRNISKVANTYIMLDRNPEATDDMERNTTRLTIQGNRFSGRTGPAGQLLFDPLTYKIRERMEYDTPF